MYVCVRERQNQSERKTETKIRRDQLLSGQLRILMRSRTQIGRRTGRMGTWKPLDRRPGPPDDQHF